MRSPSRDAPNIKGEEDIIKQYKHSQEEVPVCLTGPFHFNFSFSR